jgi:hypothetical protein
MNSIASPAQPCSSDPQRLNSLPLFLCAESSALDIHLNESDQATMKTTALIVSLGLVLLMSPPGWAQEVPQFRDLFNGKDLAGWVDVNTSPDTWSVRDGVLMCTGQPIGVMRTEKQYENFILHIEWKHLEAGGNSGVFIWSDPTPAPGKRLPKGCEVQMLDLEYVTLKRDRDGNPLHPGYVSGELFGANGLTVTPDNPRGTRSMSFESRAKGKGEWNTYLVVAVDGVIKLSINGKFVNGVSHASQRKGYICLESEGAPIHFRNIKLMELPSGRATPEQTAPLAR